MSAAPVTKNLAPVPEPVTLRQYASNWYLGLRNGELGSLPIVIGLLVIAVVFQSMNSNFLTAGNFVNLMVQGAAMATIAMGVVFVLLIGEIDLSLGYVSGVGAVLTALFLLPDGVQLPTGVALVGAVFAGALIGLLHGLLITKLKIPSFVVTLAGFLGWNGVVLLLIGSRGSIIIQDKTVVGLASEFLLPAIAWGLLAICVLAYGAAQLVRRAQRQKNSLAVDPLSIIGLRVGALAVFGGAIVLVSNLSRGIPYVFVLVGVLFLLCTFVLTRTKFGIWVYAIGGSIEAARRAGINTDRVRIICFMICSSMAVTGGIILASRLRSVDSNAGGGSLLLYSIAAAVIGGTSLFGGRGSARSAILGALVIAAIDNGLGLLGLGSGEKFVITGLVLLAAVAVDALSQKGRVQSGKG
ncbi:sugar ABC transporter permease [Salinibacterium sp. M195]|uniref:sugar ABC transporter permease n=1 Tax=Salinibacterium sp. M195 TaxID=2583374 RepID=UPI001C633FAF|nr:sugar ABC transporter permease [Salinibacterium sp. M195]QYH35029.1 ABC transporter permease [Salinibacterium sp. M195]